MSAVAKVNEPSAGIDRLSPLLFCNTRFEPLRPVTVTPTVNCDAVTVPVVSVLLTPPVQAASDRTPHHINTARDADASTLLTVNSPSRRICAFVHSLLEPIKLCDPATDRKGNVESPISLREWPVNPATDFPSRSAATQ